MRVLIASDARFTSDGDAVWTSGPEDYRFWASCAEVFERVGVLARVRRAPPSAAARRADGPGVAFWPLDDYRGPWGYLARLPWLAAEVGRALDAYDCYLLRAPGAVAYLAAGAARRRGRRFAVEVLGDPWESLGPAAGGLGPLGPLARRWSRHRLRRLAGEARAACYVTRSLLARYPPAGAAVFLCSDARLDAVAGEPELARREARARLAAQGRRSWQLGFLGSLERLYKAPEVHLEALALCLARNLDVRLSIAGDGRFRPRLERLAARLGLSGRVDFLGALPPGEAVTSFLDTLDLFVLASRTEGLPRALVEAMARGAPALGSTAGGIPDLLEPDALVEPGHAPALATRIGQWLSRPDRLAAAARRNLLVARDYLWENLSRRRQEFLWELRNSCT